MEEQAFCSYLRYPKNRFFQKARVCPKWVLYPGFFLRIFKKILHKNKPSPHNGGGGVLPFFPKIIIDFSHQYIII